MCWDGDANRRPGLDDYLRHLDHIAGLAGVEHAAFGTDIETRSLHDCGSHADLARITAALVERGWPEDHIRGFLGGNLARALGEIWGA